MSRLPSVLLTLASIVALACSGKPTTSEPRKTPDVPITVGGDQTSSTVPPPDLREAALSKIVVRLAEHEHLMRKKLDDDLSRAAFENYIERLDGGKMFILRSDRDALATHIDKIDDELRTGSFALAHEGAKIFAARLEVVDKLVTAILAAPLDFTNEEFLELDPKKRPLAANDQELRDRWRMRLELEVLERISAMESRLEADKAAAGKVPPPAGKGSADDKDKEKEKAAIPPTPIPATPAEREAKARADLAKSYSARFARLRTPAPLDAAADLVNAVTTVLDPHTTYLPPADKANFNIQMSGTLEGIGASLRERDHYIEIIELVPGGAAWRDGKLTAGDLILSVAAEGQEPVDVLDMRIDEVVKMIRGPKNTNVRLRVQKAAGNQETVTITRDVVIVEAGYARGAVLSRKGAAAYGYIYLPSFYGGRGADQRTAGKDVKKLLVEMKARRVAGVVVDIRSNGGGLLGDAVEITGHLIDKGPVVQVQDSRGRRETFSDDEPGVEFAGAVIVLVDRFSASASEILAGALQDYKRALIVGTGPTHGKGTVQTLADLDRLSDNKVELGVLKLTIQQFFRVTGSSTQREGVMPDIVLPDPAGHIESGERELDHAIAWSQVDALPHDKWTAPWKSTVLLQKSTARVSKHPLLSKIATTTQLLKTRRDDTRVPLARPAWETRRKELRTALDAISPDTKTALPAKVTVQSVGETLPPPGPTAKADDRLARWRDNLAHDAWVEECLFILDDMTK